MPRLQKIEMYYDAAGRPVKTVNPDGSEQRVIYGKPKTIGTPNDFIPSPWERYSYDQNDLAGLTNRSESASYAHQWNTPKSELIDALGRTIKTMDHKGQPDYSNPQQFTNVEMEYQYDIQGNLTRVTNAINQTAFQYKYNLQKQALYTEHVDAGISIATLDALGKPIKGTDAKDAETLASYDRLQRPTMGWSKNDSSDSLRMTMVTEYGETVSNPTEDNLLGKPYKQFDEAGLVTNRSFDFKGNLLMKTRNVIDSDKLKGELDSYKPYLLDWTGELPTPGNLDEFDYTTESKYDALNRVTLFTLPENVDGSSKEIEPTYNRAGGLEKVSYDGEEYVSEISYNAKGQRILLALGNDTMTRYAYDEKTFRLKRQRTEKFTKTQVYQTITYTPQSGTNKEDTGYDYDLAGNILKILERRTDCGITGSTLGADKLDRDFTYDPLYRLRTATGRESDTQQKNDYLYTSAPIPGSPNADNVRAYTRKYEYDEIGNVEQMKHIATGNSFTRDFVYNTNQNTLKEIDTAASTLIQGFTYDNTGNQLTAGDNRYYEWTAGNNLLIYKNQAGGSDPTIYAQYEYAGRNRVSKMVRTGTAQNPIYERTIYIDGVFEYHILENGTTYKKNYVHVMDDKSQIAMIRVGDKFPGDIEEEVVYILENQISSSTARLKANGTVIDREEYYPFGDSSLRTFEKKRYRYVGKEKDLESGLYYYGARYYAAWTCRFISVDPLAAEYPYLTPYQNAGNKPINHFDIDGLQGDGDIPLKNEGGGSNEAFISNDGNVSNIDIHGNVTHDNGGNKSVNSGLTGTPGASGKDINNRTWTNVDGSKNSDGNPANPDKDNAWSIANSSGGKFTLNDLYKWNPGLESNTGQLAQGQKIYTSPQIEAATAAPTEQTERELNVIKNLPIDIKSPNAFIKVLTVYKLIGDGTLESGKYSSQDLFTGGDNLASGYPIYGVEYEFNGTTFSFSYQDRAEPEPAVGWRTRVSFTDKQGNPADFQLRLVGAKQANLWTGDIIRRDVGLLRIKGTLNSNDYANFKSVLNYVKTGSF